MPHVDSLLALALRSGADELRLADDQAPKMLARGVPKRLAIPATDAATLRDLLGELLDAATEAKLRAGAKAEAQHAVAGSGVFRVSFARREQGLEVHFKLLGAPPAAAAIEAPELRGAPVHASPTASAPIAPPTPAVTPIPQVAPVAPVDVVPGPTSARLSGGARERGDPLMRLLLRAVSLRASDVHLAAGELPHVRVDGALRLLPGSQDPSDPSYGAPLEVDALVAPLLDAAARARVEAGASADLALDLVDPDGAAGSKLPRVRGNVYRSSRGLVAAFRLLPPEAPALDALAHGGLLSELPLLPNGLVIVCGPTGSGKTTTLAALAQEALRARSIVLVSLEDPIEFVLSARGGGVGDGAEHGRYREPDTRAPSLVRQRQIGRDVADFATGLRDALREDPDVILVGEMRDEASISLALTAAETGHLVLATLHSRSAASAIERIVDSYPHARQAQIRAQLADSLRAVVSQRLVPRARGDGRALALEVLRVTSSVANGLREGKIGTIVTAMQSSRRDGMVTLEKSLAELVRRGEVRAEDATAAANDREALANYRSSVPVLP
jgi:twitching motility protein PilT